MSDVKPTKNPVWMASRLIRELELKLPCGVEHVGWAPYRYSGEQKSEGAVTGSFVDTRTQKHFLYSDNGMADLLRSRDLRISRGWTNDPIDVLVC